MKVLYCWRCKMEVPMLNEDEYEIASKLYSAGVKNIRVVNKEDRFKELINYYNGLTGFDETNPNAIMHHRIELYGGPCESCGKPYRTPQASFCAACGHKRILK